MKEVIKPVTTEQRVFYKCDVCGKLYPYKYIAEGCEAQHLQKTCKHPDRKLHVEYDYKTLIEEVCQTCGKVTDTFSTDVASLSLDQILAIVKILRGK